MNINKDRIIKPWPTFLETLEKRRMEEYKKINVDVPIKLLKKNMLTSPWGTMIQTKYRCEYTKNGELSTMSRKIMHHFEDEGLHVADVRIQNTFEPDCTTMVQMFYDTMSELEKKKQKE